MTMNSVMTVSLRHFTKRGNFWSQLWQTVCDKNEAKRLYFYADTGLVNSMYSTLPHYEKNPPLQFQHEWSIFD